VAEKRILLVRHGRSSYVERSAWVTRAGFERYHRDYDATGLLSDDRPPAELLNEAAAADLVMSSDLPRAVESARRIAPGREIEISPLFRETNLRVPIGWLPLPRGLWGFLMHLRWGFQVVHGTSGPAAEIDRARAAAALIEERMRDHDFVVVATHGLFRGLLTYQLMQLGWRQLPGRRRRHWSVWRLGREVRQA
jgi:broad specificity phosphatase PhoE